MADAVVGVQWAFALSCPHEARALFTDIIPQFGDARRCKIISSLAAKKSQRKLRRFGAVNVLECADNIIMRHQAGNQQHKARVHPPCTLALCVRPIVLYMYRRTWSAAAYTLQPALCHPALETMLTHTHARSPLTKG